MPGTRFVLSALAALAVLAACAGAETGGKPLVISARTNDHLQQYLREVDAGRAGAFAVTEDGGSSYYSVCESGACNGQYNFSSEAIHGCEKYGQGRCVVLASNGLIKRSYTVAP